MIFYDKTKKARFINVSYPILGRMIMRLNKKPVMMCDFRITRLMPVILPAMDTRGKFINDN